MAEIVGVHSRGLLVVCRFEPHRATTLGPQELGVGAVALLAHHVSEIRIVDLEETGR